jgi:hypothetical protein
MKKVYVQIKNGFPINADIQSAVDGFEYLGFDAIGFRIEEILAGKFDNIAKLNPFVGSIDCMTALFKRINVYPIPIDFPKEILDSGLISRKIQILNIDDAIANFKRTLIPVFIKPVQTKLFDGILVEDIKYLNYFKGFEGTDVIVSNKLDILSEYRVYIHNGKMVYSANYAGDFELIPNYDYVRQVIASYASAPIAYTVDVAVVKDKDYIYNDIIEVNDFWAIGNYGLKCWDYAQMLLDRYFEIINYTFDSGNHQ